MDNNILKGNWKIFRGKIKEQWGKLTDDDLDQSEGNIDQLAGRIQARYGEGVDSAKVKLNEMFKKFSTRDSFKKGESKFDGDDVNADSRAS